MKSPSSFQLGLGQVMARVILLASAYFCVVLITSASSANVRSQVLQTFKNQTIMVNSLNATGDFSSRILWVKKRKFVLPAGTIMSLAPKITIPAFRRKAFKGALNSDFQATWFLYINFDRMGYTDKMHPFPFDLPPFFPFGPLRRPIVSDKSPTDNQAQTQTNTTSSGPPPDYGFPIDPSLSNNNNQRYITENSVNSYKTFRAKSSTGRRKPRSIMSLPPPDTLPGGERALVLPTIENMLSNFGFGGKGCMLRAICEIHEYPLQDGYGLLGEIIAVVFSISQSPYAESHMPEYLKAEEAGLAGNCAPYKRACTKSIFKWEKVKRDLQDQVDTNEVGGLPNRSKFEDDEL